ncbi:MAG TPA: dCMP deaminase family protein [Candidatus Scatovicinus merdipullorum]|nr:dCMP deaminase family protein [Candidatus Scatovicinus merdipullorum]
MKRDTYISWDEFFMGTALLCAQRSKDPNTQVGACIVSGETPFSTPHIILATGYNGLPRGCDDDAFPWERTGALCDTKYAYVLCAELNAILNAQGRNLNGATLYVTLFPCNQCAKAIIQAGIRAVVYLSDKYAGEEKNTAAKRLFSAAGIQTRQFIPAHKSITLDFKV